MPHVPHHPPLFVADELTLDLLNTVYLLADQTVDAFQSDADVLYWLTQTGLAPAAPLEPASGSLLRSARALREIVRPLVERRKAGKRLDPAELNAVLAQAPSYPQLAGNGASLRIERHRPQRTAQQLLAPVAEAAAEFLATANFDLVRRCEGRGCILWFYDRTKSHRRRWCSMQVCGNRHKVEAFRERQGS